MEGCIQLSLFGKTSLELCYRAINATILPYCELSRAPRFQCLILDSGQTLEQRRSEVIAKLCSTGTTTAEMIRAMAEALTGYSAGVTENFGEYSFSLRFYGKQAGFINIDADLLMRTVEEIKPAHLRFVIEPITWGDLEDAELTWAQLEAQFESWAALESAFYCHQEDSI